MISPILVDLADWGGSVAFWAPVALIMITSVIWPWWKSFWGLNIVLLEVAISLALLPSILFIDFNVHLNTTFGAWLVVLSLWSVGAIIVWRGALVIIEQLRGTFGTAKWR